MGYFQKGVPPVWLSNRVLYMALQLSSGPGDYDVFTEAIEMDNAHSGKICCRNGAEARDAKSNTSPTVENAEGPAERTADATDVVAFNVLGKSYECGGSGNGKRQ